MECRAEAERKLLQSEAENSFLLALAGGFIFVWLGARKMVVEARKDSEVFFKKRIKAANYLSEFNRITIYRRFIRSLNDPKSRF